MTTATANTDTTTAAIDAAVKAMDDANRRYDWLAARGDGDDDGRWYENAAARDAAEKATRAAVDACWDTHSWQGDGPTWQTGFRTWGGFLRCAGDGCAARAEVSYSANRAPFTRRGNDASARPCGAAPVAPHTRG